MPKNFVGIFKADVASAVAVAISAVLIIVMTTKRMDRNIDGDDVTHEDVIMDANGLCLFDVIIINEVGEQVLFLYNYTVQWFNTVNWFMEGTQRRYCKSRFLKTQVWK
jgi:hypothetical protein